jgi:uncharacterized protein YPO0396
LRVANKIVDDKEIAVWEWLSYNNALENVESVIADLEKIDFMKNKIEQLPEPSVELPKAKKSFGQKLSEIRIDGEPDMSTDFERLDTATLEKLANSEKSFKDVFNEMLTDTEQSKLM